MVRLRRDGIEFFSVKFNAALARIQSGKAPHANIHYPQTAAGCGRFGPISCRMFRHRSANLWPLIGGVALACARPSSLAEPAKIVAGQLPAEWYAGGADCGSTSRFRVHAYTPDLFILRQPACTNYEKPFLYLVFGRDRALL